MKNIIVILGCCLLLFIQCKTCDDMSTDSLAHIRAVFKEDKHDIIAQYNASGAGIGKDGEQYVIVVYLKEKPKTKGSLTWKGIPLKLEYTGDIKLL